MKTCCQLLSLGLVVIFVASCGKTEARPEEPAEAYLKHIQLVEGRDIEAKDEEGESASVFTIQQVALVAESGNTAKYKIGYTKTVKAGSMSFQVFGSMWLDLKPSGGKWTWGKAMYIGESKFDSRQLEPPSDLVSEAEAEKRGALTREALKRAGITP